MQSLGSTLTHAFYEEAQAPESDVQALVGLDQTADFAEIHAVNFCVLLD